MSRHRNVRRLNYEDECEREDDVYGHSVEDDYCISPATAAQFMIDRSQQHVLSSFVSPSIEEQDEEEEEESSPSVLSDSLSQQRCSLSDLDNARLNSCLETMHNILGESVPEMVMVDAIITSQFNPEHAIDAVLHQQELPKPQRTPRQRPYKGGLESSHLNGTTSSGDKLASLARLDLAAAPRLPDTTPRVPETTPRLPDTTPRIPVVRSSNDISRTAVRVDDVWNEYSDVGATQLVTPRKDTLQSEAATPSLHKSASKAKMDRVDVQKEYDKRKADGKDYINLVVIGHVDAGKSTLMGHVLYQLGFVNKKTMHKYEQESKKIGKGSFAYAWVLDETDEERSRGVTMDIAQTRFATDTKVVTLLDAPGHKDFIPNMITGAAQADVAILVINATKGEFETGFETGGQTREHAMLVRSLGVSQLLVAVNKMDTVDWSEERYSEVVKKLSQFLKLAGFKEIDVSYIPCSGLSGDNLTQPSTDTRLAGWYSGPTLVQQIDLFKPSDRPVIDRPFRMCVSDVFKGMGAGFSVSGMIQAGSVQAGDRLVVIPASETAYVKGVSIDEASLSVAFAGDNVMLTLTGIDPINVSIGSILCDISSPIEATTRFRARIVIFNITLPITRGFPVVLHYQSLTEQAHITKLVSQLHKSTGEVIKHKPRCLLKNTTALVELEVDRPVCVELYKDCKDLGRFMLRSGGVTIAAGLVTQILGSTNTRSQDGVS